MARVLALLPDLLFGSKVQGMLAAAGHEVEVISSEPDAWDQIAGSDLFIVDLCSDEIDGVGLLDTLSTGGELHGKKTLAFYRHTEVDVREAAIEAGFDLVVPRSRMNREGVALVDGLLAG
jgi:CheY-like chemotaxis protein